MQQPHGSTPIVREAGRGRSERTPILALTGVGITIGAVVALLVILAFLAYYVLG